jgi:GxxExxY protein
MQKYEEDYLDGLRERIIGCAIEVHRILGPGLLEAIYVACLCLELARAGLSFETEVYVPVFYKGERACHDMKIDILVEDCVIVEVKAVASLHPVFSAQVLTYLKLADKPNGLLLNFNATSLRAGLKKLVHPDLYKPKNKSS